MSIKSNLDQYYTSPEYAQYCYNKTRKHIDLSNFLVMEPAAGTGAFYNLLTDNKRLGFDIDPKIDGLVSGDFLKQDFVTDNQIVALSNPPFGFKSELAIKFFNKCASLNSEYICFIVPLTFRKPATQNRLNDHYHLILDETSPNKCFILDNAPHHVPCCFQIWERRSTKRTMHEIRKTSNMFKFCNKQNANIRVKRIGTKAGEYAKPGTEHSDGSMLYIRTDEVEKINCILTSAAYLDYIREIRANVAGQYSVSKSELIIGIEKFSQ